MSARVCSICGGHVDAAHEQHASRDCVRHLASVVAAITKPVPQPRMTLRMRAPLSSGDWFELSAEGEMTAERVQTIKGFLDVWECGLVRRETEAADTSKTS